MSEDVCITAYLDVFKKGRKDTFVTRWSCLIPKSPNWGTADFEPFAIEETVEDGLSVRRHRYDLTLVWVNTLTNEVFAMYEIARSKSWPLERCLMGCGWTQGFTRKQED